MTEQERALLNIHRAFAKGLLNRKQRKQSCQYVHDQLRAQKTIDVEGYWLQQGWLDEADLATREEVVSEIDLPMAAEHKQDQTQDTLTTQEDMSQMLHAFQETLDSWLSVQEEGELLKTNTPRQDELETIAPRPSLNPNHKRAKEVLQSTLHSKNQDWADSMEELSAGPAYEPHWVPTLRAEERYVEGPLLGQGGLGSVVEVEDRILGRRVARKMLRAGTNATKRERISMLEEARITGQLEHPNIMPIYELGEHEDGQIYYTMRLLPSKDLDHLIYNERYTITEAVKILQQICMGLEYAHSRGVIHRDIKPANILLGQFGEVLILDWGIAKVNDEQSDLKSNKDLIKTIAGFKGTPAYMAPELIQENIVSPAQDQYALGVVLYEILCQQLPFYSNNIFNQMMMTSTRPVVPPRERASAPDSVPEELEQICLKMLSKRPEDRFPSCRAVYERLDEFLEGTKERLRRQEQASARLKEATELATRYQALVDENAQRQAALEALQHEIKPWASAAEKAKMWELQEQHERGQQEEIRTFRAAITSYEQALKQEPNNQNARAGLASLHWQKYLEMEDKRDVLQQIYYKESVLSYDDGTYAAMFDGIGELGITSTPAGAKIQLFTYEEHENRLQPTFSKDLGETPLHTELPKGSYLLKLLHPNAKETALPIHLERNGSWSGHVKLFDDQAFNDNEFVHIPAGPFTYGGDPEAMMSANAQDITLNDYFISKLPVSFGDYLSFLNDTHQNDPSFAATLLPRSGDEQYVYFDPQSDTYKASHSNLLDGAVAERYPAGHGYEDEIPVFGISWYEAHLYTLWRSQKEGRTYRLPTEEQWEKAAGGGDGRIYPWGDTFDATSCKMGLSRPPDQLQPEPRGVFGHDTSPYGVQDIVGAVSEWVWDVETDQLDLDAQRNWTEDPSDAHIQRGGGWVAHRPKQMRIRARVSRPGGRRSYNTGFRLVCFPPDTGSK